MEEKKLVHVLRHGVEAREAASCEAENRALAERLSRCKLQIKDAASWDRFKKASNDYELVYTTCYGLPSVAAVSPVSRSYFKMWEMLVDFGPELLASNGQRQRVLFLAEGPGGFVEAYADFRRWRQGDELHAMTLRATGGAGTTEEQHGSKQAKVPRWKVVRPAGTLTMHWGADGTGDLCKLRNLRHLAEECCGGVGVSVDTFDLITADGGFDFSADFNSQEAMCLPLIAAEVWCSLNMQRPGGAFILKVFDTFSPTMMCVLQVLARAYKNVRLVKPLTSRPANSEKYVVCTGRTGTVVSAEDLKVVEALIEGPRRGHTVFNDNNNDIVQSVTEFNRRYVAAQIASIERTLSMSEGAWTHLSDQIARAAAWCRKYGVPCTTAV